MAENGNIKAGSVQSTPKAKRVRSPNYPGLNLESAIKRAEEFFEVERRNSANVTVAVKHWGFNPTSSGGIVTLAALKSFGLIDDEGSGKDRRVKISGLGLKIIQDKRPASTEREAAIKEAALRPAIHAKLWSQWKSEFPSEDNFRHALEVDYNFNEKAVEGFIQEYKDTITFAKLSDSDTISAGADNKPTLQVGDYIQWTSQGSDQFEEPRRVRAFNEDGQFVFVDDYEGGFPIGQVNKCDAPTVKNGGIHTMAEIQAQTGKPPSGTPPMLPIPAGSKPVGASIPVTRECSMTVMATGPVTQKGIDQLMAYLKLVRDSFPEA